MSDELDRRHNLQLSLQFLSTLSPQHSVLSTQSSALSPQHSVLSTTHS